MRRAWSPVVVLLGSLLACSRGAQAGPDASGGADAAIAPLATAKDGAALYASLCTHCHGADATGYRADDAPSLVNPTFLESASDEQLRRSISDGRPGTAMAAYAKERGGPLAAEDISKIVGWLRSRGPEARPLPRREPGDAKRGQPLYAASCEGCHGNATARGDAVHLGNARFLEAASDSFLDYAVRHGRPGTPMQAWADKLTDAQIADVVAHVRSFQTANPPGLLPPPTGAEPIVVNPKGGAPRFEPRSTPCPPNQKCVLDERFVSIDQVKKALDAKQRMVLIDARPPSDWMRVHIPGAVSIPYHDLRRLDEVPNDGTWVVAYCACPHHLSGDVVEALRRRGVKRAVILDEGILEWHRRGYPVVAAPGVERPPQPIQLQPIPPRPVASGL
jgi:cytochrome c oxidase cbb3-type subunit 3/ubiquinol-cytochrome c reductase cytochrome c subunit